jgi:hypothetical protein
LNEAFASLATGQEYFHVSPWSDEISRWVETLLGFSESQAATTQ